MRKKTFLTLLFSQEHCFVRTVNHQLNIIPQRYWKTQKNVDCIFGCLGPGRQALRAWHPHTPEGRAGPTPRPNHPPAQPKALRVLSHRLLRAQNQRQPGECRCSQLSPCPPTGRLPGGQVLGGGCALISLLGQTSLWGPYFLSPSAYSI